MKIKEALTQAASILNSKGVSNSKLDSLILLSYALSFSKERVIFNPDLELNEEQKSAFFELIKRRALREPVSQILGKREFFGEDFFVTKDVLDPRPDSESLVEMVLANFTNREENLKILEVGVGSGCLVITLLKHYKLASATALDISENALKIAQKNSEFHQVENRLDLKKSDLFSALTKSQKFDLIISNPPYIESEEITKLQDEVRIYEPITALDGGLDGLDFYRRIANQAKDFLTKNGEIILEIGFGQKEKVIEIFVNQNFLFIESKSDLGGIERVLRFKFC